MNQDTTIAIIDMGSTENSILAQMIRGMGVYSEIQSHDITGEQLKALKSGLTAWPWTCPRAWSAASRSPDRVWASAAWVRSPATATIAHPETDRNHRVGKYHLFYLFNLFPMTGVAFPGRCHHRKLTKSIIPLINIGRSEPFRQRNLN